MGKYQVVLTLEVEAENPEQAFGDVLNHLAAGEEGSAEVTHLSTNETHTVDRPAPDTSTPSERAPPPGGPTKGRRVCSLRDFQNPIPNSWAIPQGCTGTVLGYFNADPQVVSVEFEYATGKFILDVHYLDLVEVFSGRLG